MDEVNVAMVSLHLHDPSGVAVRAFPVSQAGPFVSVQLEPVAALLVHDVAVLDAVAAQIATARAALLRMLAGQDPFPDTDGVPDADLPLVSK